MFTQWTGLLPRRFVNEVSGVCRRAARLTLFVGELALWTLAAAGSPRRSRERPLGALVLASRALVLDIEPGIGIRTSRRASTGCVRAALALLLLVRSGIRDVVPFVGRFTVGESAIISVSVTFLALFDGVIIGLSVKAIVVLARLAVQANIVAFAARMLAHGTRLLTGCVC